jgi:hypothetical protein
MGFHYPAQNPGFLSHRPLLGYSHDTKLLVSGALRGNHGSRDAHGFRSGYADRRFDFEHPAL